jgi:hypothetical protein
MVLSMICKALVVDLGSDRPVKEFTEMENRRQKRFITMPFKKNRLSGSYAKEHSTLRHNSK